MEDIDGGLHPAVDGQSLDEMMRSYFLHYFVFDNRPLQVLQHIHSPLKQNHACIPGVSMVKC